MFVLAILKVVGLIPCQVCYSFDCYIGAINCSRGRSYRIKYCDMFTCSKRRGRGKLRTVQHV